MSSSRIGAIIHVRLLLAMARAMAHEEDKVVVVGTIVEPLPNALFRVSLENGHKIRVVETEYESIGVDTPDDLERVNKLFEATLAGVIQNG